ncbi:DNA adenine methylase [Caloramator quimbayensis]|uniref:Site-specific DNA-methyltransferase (adenine-specific) n=1 Tax=Caloramator quimbayensis TaxID=1147123 RepID=A0A1T4Y9B9_9CLOT|nr:DNA adenine methylase [Caloramator quimbayensis]SKA98293.1 DNA adenine methylase [Caloramator quimbayensis]
MSELAAKPFLKWAGGKSQLLPKILDNLPQRLKDGKIKKYAEPFLGGGAVFFYLSSIYNFEQIILNDINSECILTYKVIQQYVDDLIKILSEIESEYINKNDDKRQEMFYERRDMFNDEKTKIDYNNFSDMWISHAANMIFLNKTCFNGLYRQNRKGQFNVPFGKYKNPTICDIDNLKCVNKALYGVKLTCGDFEILTSFIDENTFVYMDPPYRPLNNTSNFTDYSKEPFNDESQKRLAAWFYYLDSIGASLMLSNSDPTNSDPDDDFFDKLYEDFTINRVDAIRSINSKGSGRGTIRELLILNNK